VAFVRLFVAIPLAGAAFAFSSSSPAGEQAVRFGLLRVASGLREPVHLAAPRGPAGALYVVERRGVVRVIDGSLRPEPFLDVSRRVGTKGLRGLFSIAFHPHYVSNRRFYVFYADRRGEIVVAEYRSDGRRARPASARTILRIRESAGHAHAHYGGQLAFGPDGRLYAGIGDGVSGGAAAQDRSTLLGKLVRIDVDGRAAEPEVVAYGLRNPWRFSFDRATGTLFIGDVGGNTRRALEEVNVLPRASAVPVNFGWDAFEARRRRAPRPVDNEGSLRFPIVSYGHAGKHCSVTGGFVYRGRDLPSFRGRYFFGDFCSGTVWSLRGRVHRVEPLRLTGLSSFGEDAQGELYFLGITLGSVYRLAAAG
jgi:glucose/arabinose dehydrogenase